MNYARYIAGVGSISVDNTLNERAQYGAVLCASVKDLSHSPSKAADMTDEFYNKGLAGEATSNLIYGPDSIVGHIKGLVADLGGVAHRTGMLSTSLNKVGIGMSGKYAAVCISGTGDPADVCNFVAWPSSGNFPQTLMWEGNPWSITIDNSMNVDCNTFANEVVTLTRISDNRTWVFDSSVVNSPISYKDNYFRRGKTIQFSVGENQIGALGYTGVFHVKVTGLKDTSGNNVLIEYDVNLFDDTVTDIKSLSLNKSKITIGKGSSYKLSATITPASASCKPLRWVSENPDVAVVDSNGNVTAKKAVLR